VSIELIETQKLINELLSRYDNAVFCGLKLDKDHDYHYNYKGLEPTCLGLCDILKNNILLDLEDDINGEEISG
jgi:hypothetical protein